MKIESSMRKTGRVIDVTIDCIDFLKFDVKLSHSSSKTIEFAVTSKRLIYFSEPEDSGGSIVESDEKLVDIIIEGTLGVEVWEGHGSFGVVKLSYVTPWSLIKQRVRENIGCDIELLKSKVGD